MKVNTTLEVFYLEGNLIGNKGTQALAEGLKVNTTLEILRLSQESLNQVNQLLTQEAILNCRNRLESLQRKCARLIKEKELDCSPIPKIIRETFSLPSRPDH